jgi:hypothetical protein
MNRYALGTIRSDPDALDLNTLNLISVCYHRIDGSHWSRRNGNLPSNLGRPEGDQRPSTDHLQSAPRSGGAHRRAAREAPQRSYPTVSSSIHQGQRGGQDGQGLTDVNDKLRLVHGGTQARRRTPLRRGISGHPVVRFLRDCGQQLPGDAARLPTQAHYS